MDVLMPPPSSRFLTQSKRIRRLRSADEPMKTAGRIALSHARLRIPRASASLPVVPYGKCRIRADLRTSLGLRLYRYRSMSPDVRAVLDALEPGDCFLDGGANIGLFTLPAAAKVGPRGLVLAIEPGTVNRRLADNIALNGFTNVDLLPVGLDERDGGARDFLDLGGDRAGLSSFVTSEPVAGSVITVPTRSLDSITENLEAPPRVVKLDLEGAEIAAMRGAERLLAEDRPFFLVEVEDDHLRRHGGSAAELREEFARYNYQAVDQGVAAPNQWFAPQ